MNRRALGYGLLALLVVALADNTIESSPPTVTESSRVMRTAGFDLNGHLAYPVEGVVCRMYETPRASRLVGQLLEINLVRVQVSTARDHTCSIDSYLVEEAYTYESLKQGDRVIMMLGHDGLWYAAGDGADF